ncbi:metallophosphoesterase family protein [Devosia sp. CAU 1758]
MNALKRLFGSNKHQPTPRSTSRHLNLETSPSAVYAIGDVHGCLDELRALERKIAEDSAGIPGDKLLVMLGDYIDRGPNSAGVLDYLLVGPPPSFKRICLMGNHEVMASAFMDNPHPRSDWLQFGGSETLLSYGLSHATVETTKARQWGQMIGAYVPQEHVDFLRSLPWTLSLPGWLFVHAGVRPGVALLEQSPDDLFWIREEFFEATEHTGAIVVHGHTPAAAPVVTPARICIDTGAYATGILTALRITPDGKTAILHSS